MLNRRVCCWLWGISFSVLKKLFPPGSSVKVLLIHPKKKKNLKTIIYTSEFHIKQFWLKVATQISWFYILTSKCNHKNFSISKLNKSWIYKVEWLKKRLIIIDNNKKALVPKL